MTPDEYAIAILKDKQPAGQWLRTAAERHLRDREEGLYIWSPQRAERVESFLRHLWIDTRNGRKPFHLLPWQRFVVGSIFNWLIRTNDPHGRVPGSRRYRRCYIETAKGSGKSPLGAGITAYMALADGYFKHREWIPQSRPYIAVCAATQDQAIEVSLSTLRGMTVDDERIRNQFGSIYDKAHRRISYQRTGAIARAVGVSGVGRALSGLILTMVVAEEMHEWPDAEHLEMLEAGFKASVQPLTYIATNAGRSRSGPCWTEREKAIEALSGTDRTDKHPLDNVFSYIACVDDLPPVTAANPWPPADKWIHANPGLGTTVGIDYVGAQIDAARSLPQKSEVRRLQFGSWEGDITGLVDLSAWRLAEQDVDVPEDAELFVGIDLGDRQDMTALAKVWCWEGGMHAHVEYWTPADGLEDLDGRSSGFLQDWAHAGHINLAPGRTMNYEIVAKRVIDLADTWSPMHGTIDPWRMVQLRDALARIGETPDMEQRYPSLPERELQLIPHPQKAGSLRFSPMTMEASVDAFAAAVADGKITISPSPVLRWNLGNAAVETNADGCRRLINEHPAKRRARQIGAIDGVAALVMAVGLVSSVRGVPDGDWMSSDYWNSELKAEDDGGEWWNEDLAEQPEGDGSEKVA